MYSIVITVNSAAFRTPELPRDSVLIVLTAEEKW